MTALYAGLLVFDAMSARASRERCARAGRKHEADENSDDRAEFDVA